MWTCLPFIRLGQNHLASEAGRQKKRWEDNIREWTGPEFTKSQRAVENREQWRKLVVKSSLVHRYPSWLRDRCRWRTRQNAYFQENSSFFQLTNITYTLQTQRKKKMKQRFFLLVDLDNTIKSKCMRLMFHVFNVCGLKKRTFLETLHFVLYCLN